MNTKKESTFFKKFISEAKHFVEAAFDKKLNEQEFDELKKFIKFSNNTLSDNKVGFMNSYNGHNREMKLLDIIDFIMDKNPILTGNGTLFKPEFAGGKNVAGKFIIYLLDSRSEYKKKKFEFTVKKSDENKKANPNKTLIKQYEDGENLYDLQQSSTKVFTNAYYGAMGQKTFIFHDKNCAPAVTSAGASAITSIVQKFESTIGDHWGFKYTSDVLEFIDDIVNMEKFYEIEFDKEITEEMVYDRLINKINEVPDEEICKIIKRKLKKVGTQEILDRLYYCNNFYEFIKEPQIVELVKEIFKTEILSGNIEDVNKSKDEDFKKNINTFSDLIIDYCYIPKSYEDRMKFADTTHKKVVLVVDTDSSFVYLDPFVEFFENKFKKKNEEWEDSKYITLANIMIFMVCHLSKLINDDYCNRINIEEQRKHWLNLKNEFLFKKIMLTRNKKNYAGSLVLQEGKILYPPKFDMKGLSIKKVTVNRFTRKYFSDILQKDILESKDIILKDIMNKFVNYESLVKESILKGESQFLIPDRYGNINNYKFPFREEVVRGIVIWNEIYRSNKIPPMSNVNKIKLNGETIESFNEIIENNTFDEEETKILEKLRKVVFDNENLSHYGFGTIAIPKDAEEIPKWIIPFIDIQSMIDNNIRNALILLESLGVQVVTTDTVNRMSNIISF